jgi:hypothetical protein
LWVVVFISQLQNEGPPREELARPEGATPAHVDPPSAWKGGGGRDAERAEMGREAAAREAALENARLRSEVEDLRRLREREREDLLEMKARLILAVEKVCVWGGVEFP